MPRITYTENTTIGSPFPGNLDLVVPPAGDKAVYVDDTSGSTITLVGRNLAEDPATDNTFVSGRVEKVVFRNVDGEILFKITDASYRAEGLGDAYVLHGSGVMIDKMFMGPDVIIGSDAADLLQGMRGADLIFGGRGADNIWGGRGDDRMAGGARSDLFQITTFEDGRDDDVITDLNIFGPGADMLTIDIDFTAKRTGGGDTLLELLNGGTVLLEGVRKADFVDWWDL